MLVVVDGVIHEVVVVSATDAAGNVGTQRQRLTIIG